MEERGTWWREAKFGMFIHWGLYALLAGSYAGRESGGNAEWIMHDLHIPPEEYRTLAGRFDPVDFDADALVRLCREAGMRYIVFTAKHHDGFAMYHSRASRYNIVDATPFGRDVAMELKRACDRHGVRLCFYYSQAQDWDHPGGLEEGKAVSPEAFQGYLEQKCLPQVRELLEGYGPLGLVWYDTPMDMPRADCLRMRDLVRTLQPDCLVSGRVGHELGDYMTTGDDFIPLLAYGGPFEVPATMNGTWGYATGRRRWKRPEAMVRDLVRIVSRGGNYLLNVGPDPTGVVPAPALDCLRKVGEWMRVNGEAIYATQRSEIFPPWGECIRKDEKKNSVYYLSVFQWPEDGKLAFDTKYTVKEAMLLADGTKLKFTKTPGGITIQVPTQAPDKIATVVRLELKEKLPAIQLISNTAKAFEIADE